MGYCELNLICMFVVIAVIGFLVLLSLVTGSLGCVQMDIAFEINLLNSPYYKLGLFSERYDLEDGTSEHELVIGLFFLNVIIVFWKTND